MIQRIQQGTGFGWGEHHEDIFEGTERFFRPSYLSQLVPVWIPAIKGLPEKLASGAKVADVGCGHGVSTIVMATAYPKSRFIGFDSHEPSLEKARLNAREAGISNVEFRCALSDKLSPEGFDLIAYFDSLHDMADPIAACKSARSAIKEDGFLMIVEPMAGRSVEENFNEVGRIYSAASVLCCTANAIAGGGTALGTIATDEELGKVVKAAGFSVFKRATESPANRVFEARVQ
jgi:2-polyprenyl-3-methyl-5-hydroxy-6-metoxy-1,4-benzoquinol methylase